MSGAALLADTLLADLEIAYREREEEAAILRQAGFHSISIAMRIYSLEIRIKTHICKHLKLETLPSNCKTHDLSLLIIFTGLWAELNQAHNSSIRRSWDYLVDYSKKQLNEARYLPRSSLSLGDYSIWMSALDDTNDGVIAWLSRPR